MLFIVGMATLMRPIDDHGHWSGQIGVRSVLSGDPEEVWAI
jgi:hypothetical protein